MATTIIAGVAGGLARIAVDANHVYYRPPTSAASGAIYAAGKDGSNPTPIATGQTGNGGMASDGAWVYWATFPGSNIGTIQRAPLESDGGIGGASVLLSNLGQPDEIVVDATNVYYQEFSYNQVSRARTNGSGAPTLLACDLTITAMALDPTSVYWTTTSGQIAATSITDSADGETCIASNSRVLTTKSGAFGVAVTPGSASGGQVFYTVPSGGSVWSVPKTGACVSPTCPRELATGQSQPTRTVADATAVYWITSDAVWSFAY
jgi:hypothetical protein